MVSAQEQRELVERYARRPAPGMRTLAGCMVGLAGIAVLALLGTRTDLIDTAARSLPTPSPAAIATLHEAATQTGD